MKHCGYCGKQIEDHVKFCPWCGRSAGRGGAGQTPSAPKKTCGQCGRSIAATARFCPYCGGKNDATGAEPPRPGRDVRPGRPSRPRRAPRPKKRRWIAAVAAALVVCIGVGGFLAYSRGMLDRLFNPSAKYHTEENGYATDGKEFTYASPTDESHLKPVVEGNDDLRYADNELIVQLANPTTEAEARRIARENGAELVGFISVSGTCQWRLDRSYSYDELSSIAARVLSNEKIEYAGRSTTIEGDATEDIQKSESIWLDNHEQSWGYFDIGADAVLDDYNLSTPVNVGIIDSGFQPHYDINDKGYLPTLVEEKVGSHGTHVAGIIAANPFNDIGIRGVYPCASGTGESKLFTRTWTKHVYKYPFLDKGKVQLITKSSIQNLNVMVGLILNNCKVINCSYGLSLTSTLSLWAIMDGHLPHNKYISEYDETIRLYNKVLKCLIDHGHQFLIVSSAGNDCLRNTDKIFYYDKATDGFKVDKQKDKKDRINLGAVIPAKYSSLYNGIVDKDVRERIIVVGAYGKNGENYSIANFSCMDETVDIMAPGVAIYSTGDFDIIKKEGTSMAAPFVTGAIACIWSLDENLKANEVKSLVLCDWPQGCDLPPIDKGRELTLIKDEAYSHCNQYALNLRKSMEMAKTYIDSKPITVILDSPAQKTHTVRIKTFVNETEYAVDVEAAMKDSTNIILNPVARHRYETDSIGMTIISEDGVLYADKISTNYDKADTRMIRPDSTPSWPWNGNEEWKNHYHSSETAYYITLPEGKYSVTLELDGCNTQVISDLDPTVSYRADEAGKRDADSVIWCFDLDKLENGELQNIKTTKPPINPTNTPIPIPTITPTPQTTPKPTKKPDSGNVDYTTIFLAKIDELVKQYGVMAGEPQVKTVGREYNWAPIWTSHESEGMLFGDIFDYDADGAPELLTMRNAPGQGESNFFDLLFLEIYEVKDGACVLSDTANISAQGLSMGGWAGTGVSAFRYSLNGAPAIGVLCETDSGMDWVVATLSYGYTGELLLMNNGVKYGSWPGAYAEEGEEGGYLSACFEAVSEKSALYTSANGDTFEHWKVVANSGQNSYDAQVNDVYWKCLGKIGLTPRSGGALSDRLLQEGRFLQQPVNDYIRYHSAADSLETLEGSLTMLGNLTNEYFIESDIYFARDYLYEDMQEFIAVGNLATGSFDRQAQPSQPTLVPVELPPVPHFDDAPAEPTQKPKASADDSEKALRKKVMAAYSGSGDIQGFGYSDFDWDGRHEAFALLGIYNDSTWENTCELWFVSPDTCTRLEKDKGYYPGDDIVTEGGYVCYVVNEGYFGSGSKTRLWTVLDGQPVLYSQSEYAGQSGEVSREVYLEDRDSGGDVASNDSGHGGTVKIREAGQRSNVRTGPGLDCDTLGVLSGGMELEFLNETSIDGRGVTWYKVRFEGRDGWVSEKYTELRTH